MHSMHSSQICKIFYKFWNTSESKCRSIAVQLCCFLELICLQERHQVHAMPDILPVECTHYRAQEPHRYEMQLKRDAINRSYGSCYSYCCYSLPLSPSTKAPRNLSISYLQDNFLHVPVYGAQTSYHFFMDSTHTIVFLSPCTLWRSTLTVVPKAVFTNVEPGH